MPIDPSIPLSVKPPEFLSPAQMITLRNLSRQGQLQELQMAEAQRQQQVRGQTQQIFQQPGAVENGMPSLATINQLYGIDPEMAGQLGQQRGVALSHLSVEQQRRAQRQQDQQKVKDEIGRDALNAYDLSVQQGAADDVAMRAMTEARNAAVDELWKSGRAAALGFTDQDRQQATSAPPDPMKLRAHLSTPEQIATAGRKAPTTRMRIQGTEEIQEEWEPKTGTWKQIGKGPRSSTPRVSADAFEGKNGELLAALAERGVSLPAGFRSKEQQLALLNSLRQRNPSLTPDEIAEKVKTGQIDLSAEKKRTQVAAGIAGRVAYAENEIEQTIPLVREASAKLPRGQFVPWNRLKQMGEASFSNPDLAEFRMFMTSLSNAYDMLAARGGTDVEKRAESRKNFDTAASPEALERVLQAVLKEAKASGRAAAAALKPPGSGEGAKQTAPAAAIEYLREHPETKDAFKAKYGYLP